MVYVMTRKGKHHSVSEDAVLVDREVLSDTTAVCAVPDNGFICVADGVGGNSGGAEASGFVLKELAKWDEEHRKLLDKIAPEQFDVSHYAALAVLKKK